MKLKHKEWFQYENILNVERITHLFLFKNTGQYIIINELEIFFKFHREEKQQSFLHFNSPNRMHLYTFQLSRFVSISNLPICSGDSRLRRLIPNILMERDIYRF